MTPRKEKDFKKGKCYTKAELEPYMCHGVTLSYMQHQGYLLSLRSIPSLIGFVHYMVSTNGGESNVSKHISTKTRPRRSYADEY